MWELTPALIVALVVAAWWITRRRPRDAGPMPDVDAAPSDAEPMTSHRLNDDGLGTYSLDLSNDEPDRAS